MEAQATLDHLYKKNFSIMVAGLLKHVGITDIEEAEDIVQETFLAAHRQWEAKAPDQPEAWLFKVSRNLALKNIRDNKKRSTYELRTEDHVPYFSFSDSTENIDELLRIILACAQPVFSARQQLVFALRYAVGFKIEQIAFILGCPADTITKVLQRIRFSIRDKRIDFNRENFIVSDAQKKTLLKIIYLMFNEGYRTSRGRSLLNLELCEDALTLAREMAGNTVYHSQDAKALFALILFNLARFEARFDQDGEIIDLENQDRTKWNTEMIRLATHHLSKAQSKILSTYHIEAAIAYLHCIAPSFEQTNWNKVIKLHQKLIKLNESPFAKLNLAIAFFYGREIETAQKMLDDLKEITFINNYHLYHVAYGKLYVFKNEFNQASKHFRKAIELTLNEIERRYIQQLTEKLN